jgi:hypothetical protein
MMNTVSNRFLSALALALALGTAAACSTTQIQPAASPGGTDVRDAGNAWARDECRREGGVWREWRCDRPQGG